MIIPQPHVLDSLPLTSPHDEGNLPSGKWKKDPAYILHVVVPFLASSVYIGERPPLPMIDLYLSKEEAIPVHIWGLLFDWGLLPDTEDSIQQKMRRYGLSVFLQGYEQRALDIEDSDKVVGINNERKKIYFSALTPDLYEANYKQKVTTFFDVLLAPQNAGQPLMSKFYDNYFDLYWDLHLNV
ncbi:MAG: hypothetical protein JOZ51_28205, partial [Chloroflexi bacterium]|nr:hypothetical protein [Chloroflexota bacterium]